MRKTGGSTRSWSPVWPTLTVALLSSLLAWAQIWPDNMHIPAHNVSKINSDRREKIFSQHRYQIRVSISAYFCPQISSHPSPELSSQCCIVVMLLMVLSSYKFSFLVRHERPSILFIKPAGPLRCWLAKGLVIRRPSSVITYCLSLSLSSQSLTLSSEFVVVPAREERRE